MKRKSLTEDLCLLVIGIDAFIVYFVLAVMNVPFLAFCWLLAIPLYVSVKFVTRQ